MLKAELEELVAEQKARIAELEAGEAAVRGYLVFAGDDCYPWGGFKDYRQCFAEEGVAVEFAEGLLGDDGGADWAEVVELPTGRVQEFGREEGGADGD